MKKNFLLLILLCLNLTTANASEESEFLKCENTGLKVVKITAGAQKISNIEPLATWRASCAEKPPVGIHGKIVSLCDGDLISKNGFSRRIFYWEGTDKKGDAKIGYHLCDHVQ